MKSTRSPLLARLSLALVAALPLTLPLVAAPAARAQVITQADRCRQELAKANSRYLEKILKGRIRCENKIVSGDLPLATNCITGLGDSQLYRTILKAQDRLSNTGKACNGVDFQLLGFPGVCPDNTGFPFDTIDFQECVVNRTNAINTVLLDVYYPPVLERLRGNAAICLKGSPRDAASSLFRKIRARQNCLIGQDFGVVDTDVDCYAKILPYGPGTGDRKVNRKVSRAYTALLGTIPLACADVQIDDLDYQSDCPDDTGGVFNIFDLKKCFFDIDRYGALEALATVFPTDGICGDGVVTGEEECDDGPNNSNTQPNACRTDCTNPSCPDGVVDPAFGEQCDDGNLIDGDCCSSECMLDLCGDGNVTCDEECDDGENNSDTTANACRTDCTNARCGDGFNGDNGEECDDGNTVSNDGCSNLCFIEFCGDGIVQSGGTLMEECDDGGANANEPDKCRATGDFACKDPFCGDLIVDMGETCDDGNTILGDGCDNCAVCGDGIKGELEECDLDGSVCAAGAGCNSMCKCEAGACPDRGELVLYAGYGTTCSTNGDCPVGTCEDGRCRTATRLDSGWIGLAHDSDINDGITHTRASSICPGNGADLRGVHHGGPRPFAGQLSLREQHPHHLRPALRGRCRRLRRRHLQLLLRRALPPGLRRNAGLRSQPLHRWPPPEPPTWTLEPGRFRPN